MSAATPRGAVLALLADCKESPSEDGYRLILADWLEENGDPFDQARAELIRCQLSYERLPADDPSRDGQGRRARWLQQRHARDWLGPLSAWDPNGSSHRGLLVLTLTPAALRSKALQGLAGGEPWAWVEEVQVSHAGDHDVGRLADSPLLGTVCAVGFPRGQVGPAGAQALAGMPWLSRVARLDLSLNPVGDAGLLRLLRSPHLTRLGELTLANAGLPPEAGGALGRAGCTGRLRRLSLSGNHLGDLGIVGLTRHGPLGAARAPPAGQRRPRPRGGGGPDKPSRRLRYLDLRDNAVGPRGAAAAADSPHLSRLEALVLCSGRRRPTGPPGWSSGCGRRAHVSPVGT
ncbi:MAG: TIGR02996 domain-containing protein [Gemmataceae bacterium]